MDFRPDDDAAELAGLVRELCHRHVTEDSLAELDARFGPGAESGGRTRATARLHEGLWSALVEAGVPAALSPAAAGGEGLGVVAAALVARELGRAVAPVPLESAVCAVPLLLAAGLDDEARRVAAGGAIAAVGDDPLVPDAGIDWAPVADLVVTECPWLPGGGDPSTQRAVHVGALPDERFRVERLVPVDYSCTGVVGSLHHAPVHVLPLAELERHRLRRRLLLAARQWGVLESALERTAAYARERRQFGRPIGSFQAVSARLADAFLDVDAVRLSVLRAADELDRDHADPGPAARDAVASAHWWACEAGHRVAHTAVHVHGGVGLDREAAPHRYFLAAKAAEFRLGGATAQLLDLGALLAEHGDPFEAAGLPEDVTSGPAGAGAGE